MGHEDDPARVAAEDAPIALVRCTGEGTVVWANRTAQELLDVVAGADLTALAAGPGREQLAAFLAGFTEPARRARTEVTTVDGVPLELLATGDVSGTVTVVAYELSAFHHQLDQIRRSARTDMLTGLSNRLAFFEDAQAARVRTSIEGTDAVLAVIDLDQFKGINDRYGHGVGDEALQWVAGILDSLTDDGESASRFGGDEFVVCFPDGGMARAETYSASVSRELQAGFTASTGAVIAVTASIGLAELHVDADVGHVLQEADVALYRAKGSGRARTVVYTPDGSVDNVEVRHLSRTVERLRTRADVDTRTGLARDHVFDADLRLLCRRARRTGSPLSLILVDLDSFHDFNERYLYESGHRALRRVAAAVVGAVRAEDRCYRYGGEELAVILEDTGADQADATAQRIRAAVEALAITHEATPGGVLTVSAGVSTTTAGTPAEPAWLVNGANVALIAAKVAGRNEVRHGDPTPHRPAVGSRR